MSEYCRDDFGLVEQADDDFKMWQGLVGPHYTPSVSEDGTLSWSNNGQLPNPEDVNVKGPPGEPGPPGQPGPGVPAGGTTGQLLAKASDEDYDGEWIDPPEMDAGQVSYDSTETYSDGTVGKELTTINSALTSLQSVTEIIDTASGAIASFPDGSGLPMRSLVAEINPVQDLHGYENPWPAGGGVNKADSTKFTQYATAYGLSFQATSKGFRAYGTVSAGVESTTHSFRTVYVNDDTLDLANLHIKGFNMPTGATARFDTSTRTIVIDSWTFGAGDVIDREIDVVIYEGSTAPTAWSPYSNECPISGWTGLSGKRCGKNLYDSTTYPLTNGKWISGEKGTLADNNDMSATVNYIPCGHLAGQAITLNKRPSGYKPGIAFYSEALEASFLSGIQNNGATAGNPWTIDVPSNAKYMRFTTIANATEVQIETGSTASTYEAYTSLPITVSWQTEAGTVYGGTVDVVTGVLTVTHRYVLLDGTQTINKHSTTAYNGFHLNLANNGLPACASTEDGTVGQFSYYKLGKLINANGNAFVGSNTIQFRNDSLTTKDEAIAYLTANPLQVVYPLATTQTYQLTPQQISTLLGNNTVFVDTGSVSVTYQASIKGYIDKVLAS